MTPVNEGKRAALAEYKHSPNVKTPQVLLSVKNKVQKTATSCPNKCWQELSHDIQTVAVTGNIRVMYEDINSDLIRHCKTIPLQPLHDTLCQRWSEGGVPQDTRDAKFVTLYKT